MTLADIRSRVEAATPGPWLAVPAEDDTLVRRVHRDEQDRRVTSFIAQAFDSRSGEIEAEPNAVFIAASRTDVPLLLAVAEAAQALVDDWVVGDQPDGDKARDPNRCVLRDALAALEAGS